MKNVHQSILDKIGKGEPKAKQVKLAQKARKPQAAKNGPKKAHACDQCESSFNRPADLKRHIHMVHLEKLFKCTQCDSAFGRNSELNNHIKSAHENAFVCPTCKKSFATELVLTDHIASVHEGIRYKCDFCDETYASRGALWNHKNRAHKK